MILPGWLKPALIVMGACTPGGCLFLLALLTNSSINMAEIVWYLTAAAGGLGGWALHRHLVNAVAVRK